MKTSTRTILTIFLIILFVLAMVAAIVPMAFAYEGQSNYNLVFVCPNYEHADYWGKVIAGINQADAELGITTDIVGGTSYDDYQHDVLRAMREVLDSDKYDAILAFCGIDDSVTYNGQCMADMLKEAQEKGIPVIAVDSEATVAGKAYREAYIGTDLGNFARNAANYMYKIVGDNAKVGVIVTSSVDGNDKVKVDSFKQYAAAHMMTVVEVADTGGARAEAERKTELLIQNNPGLSAIFVTGTTNVEGVGDYISKHPVYKNLAVVALDESQDIIDYIEDGVINATFIQQTKSIGYLGVYYAYQFLNTGYLPKQSYDTGTVLLTKSNLQTYEGYSATKQVTVGYYNDVGGKFQVGSSDGERKSGYAYEYYQQISSVANWTYNYVYCNNVSDALLKLKNGDVDIVAGVSSDSVNFDPKTMYLSENNMGYVDGLPQLTNLHFAVMSIDLLNDLNNAVRTIKADLPTFTLTLYQKYYSESAAQTLSTEEKIWLSEKKELKIGYIVDNLPLSDTEENGEVIGLIKELVDEIADPERGFLAVNGVTDVTVTCMGFETAESLEAALNTSEIDIVFPIYSDYWLSESRGLKQTDSIFSDRLMIVFRDDDGKTNTQRLKNIAASPRAIGYTMYIQNLYPNINSEIQYFNTLSGALDALVAGDADCLVGCSSVLQRYWNSINDHVGLTSSTLDKTADFSMAVYQDETILVEILNKFVRQSNQADITNALAKYSIIESHQTVGDFIKNNMFAVLGVLLVVVAIIVTIFVMYLRQSKRMNVVMQNALDAAEHANKAKTTFLSSMSHDIRTPMNAIVGMTAIAKKSIDDKDHVIDCLGKITLASNHLLTLINDVLDISKIESGKLALHPVNFSLRDMLTSLANIVRPMVIEKKQRFEVHVHGIVYENVCADTVRVNQVFINILTNAVKYTPEGGRISVDLTQEVMPDGKNVRITYVVDDTGMGMSKEYMANMYDAFTRAEDSRTNKIQGTGLGLAIVKQMVTMMNGTIDCESELDCGTKFTIKLVLPIGESEPQYASLENVNLLAVYEDPVLLGNVVEVAQELGAHMEIASNGEKFFELLRENHDKYSAIIVDWRILEEDTQRTVADIRKIIGAKMPILVSAYDCDDVQDKLSEVKVNGMLAKPLFRSAVYEKLRDVLHIDDGAANNDNGNEEDLNGLKLIVAEDNDLNWEVISELLDMFGISCERAENGKVCLEKISAANDGEYDLILMDVQMPVMDGRTATREIRKSHSEYVRNIPIIAMTADAFAEDIAACMDAGMNGHLSKPVDIDKLCQEIRKILFAKK